ncbi:uncharacterized protein LOC129591765 [Paramacrobiotus metropolitanus]|uniref:uncharacterized protein LOC129591765 n=1 Tax=Paramacrobiotus metropolitanus TaxID=2943436 RepID=UPI00244630C3|nr:uncharacterized protein LOC129591765 [Paramacrobiotus metropolitanus]
MRAPWRPPLARGCSSCRWNCCRRSSPIWTRRNRRVCARCAPSGTPSCSRPPLDSDLVLNGRADGILLASLVHALRPSTRRVILRNANLESLHNLSIVASYCRGIRASTVYVHRLKCRLCVDPCPHRTERNSGRTVGDFAEALRRLPCGEVSLLQCRVNLLDVDGDDGDPGPLDCEMDTRIDIPVAHLQPPSAVSLGQVWELLRAHLAWTPAADDKQRAADWLVELRANQVSPGQDELLLVVCQTVCALQHALLSAGPPTGAGPAQCSRALLDADVERAAPLVLACLVQGAEQWEMRPCDWEEDWEEGADLTLLQTRVCRSGTA